MLVNMTMANGAPLIQGAREKMTGGGVSSRPNCLLEYLKRQLGTFKPCSAGEILWGEGGICFSYCCTCCCTTV